MIKKINRKALDIVLNGKTPERVFLCEQDFSLFMCYYAMDYIKYNFADFHFDFFQDIKDLMSGKYREVAWIAFRESAKTSFAKTFLLWLICYKKRLYINVDSFDKENAERVLFDIVVELQTNKKIKNDFGELFNAKRDSDNVTQKRINNFLTTHGVRVEAHSTQESVRGRLHGHQRPDFLLLDDFETNKTKDSKAYTEQVIKHIDEFKAGLDSSANILYLGNYITEFGSVQSLMDRAKTDDRLLIRNIPVIKDGLPTWSAKYSLEFDPTGKKISLADKRKQLGSQVFSAEMMNQPIDELTQEFYRKNFKYKTLKEIMDKVHRRFITIDSALTKNANSDYTGVIKNFVTENNDWNIIAKQYKINSKSLIDLIFQFHNEGFEQIGIEEGAFTQAVQPFFEDECRKRNQFPNTVMLKHGGIMKETRIRGLIPRYEMGTIYHIEDSCNELEEQLLRFPRGLHDDVCFVAGTKIEVPNGNIISQVSTGIKDIYSFMGSEVTSNHPYLTQRGFIRLDSLRYSDRIIVWKNKSLMELSLDGIQNQKTLYIGTIFHLLKRNLQVIKQNVYIDIYGKNIMVKYLKVMISTIKTIIHLITIYLTSKLYRGQNTINYMLIFQKILKDLVKMPLKIMQKCRKLLKYGEIVQKENDGIVNIQKRVLINQPKLYVLSVESQPLDSYVQPNFVPINVVIDGTLENGEKIIKDTILKDLKYLGKKEVFATKTSSGWFLANGVVVSNCDALAYQLKIAEPPSIVLSQGYQTGGIAPMDSILGF